MTISIDTFLENPKECFNRAKKGETIIVIDYDGTIIKMKRGIIMITVGTYIFKQRLDEYLEHVINGEKLLIIDGNGNEIIMTKNEKGENKK